MYNQFVVFYEKAFSIDRRGFADEEFRTEFYKALKKQKEDALEYVVDQYMPLVKAIAINVLQPLGKMDAVNDCVNDVFLSVWQHAHQFEGEMEDFKKWIGMIAKYKASVKKMVLTMSIVIV